MIEKCGISHPGNSLILIITKCNMYSSFRGHKRTPGDIGSLKDELSLTYATNEKMRVFDSAKVYGRYLTLFGPLNLKVFMLSVQARELKMKIELLSNAAMPGRDYVADEENIRLEVLKNQVGFNSGMLIGVSLEDLPSEEETEEHSALLCRVTRTAHPIFYTDGNRSRKASGIMLRASMAFRACHAEDLRRLRANAEKLSSGMDNSDAPALRENIKKEIVRLRTERERMIMQFPLSLTHRINDPIWRMVETERLLQEERAIKEICNHYESLLRPFMN